MHIPKMDSIEDSKDVRVGGPRINAKNNKVTGPSKDAAAPEDDEQKPQLGLFEQSPSSSIKDLQRKLDQVVSPSESKVSETH